MVYGKKYLSNDILSKQKCVMTLYKDFSLITYHGVHLQTKRSNCFIQRPKPRDLRK